MKLLEVKRNQLISKSKNSYKGKQRLAKRTRIKVSPDVKNYNEIDMNILFKNNILRISIPVIGETDNYIVIVAFGKILDYIHRELDRVPDTPFTFKIAYRALVNAFNNDDVYVDCSCPDSRYRFRYHQTRTNVIAGNPPERRPSNITNPKDSLGAGCKHELHVLNNISWINKVASVIVNYVNYAREKFPDAYEKVIYPAIYEKKYSEDDQEILDNNIEGANKRAIDRGRFQKGNKMGIRFAKNDDTEEVPENEPLNVEQTNEPPTEDDK